MGRTRNDDAPRRPAAGGCCDTLTGTAPAASPGTPWSAAAWCSRRSPSRAPGRWASSARRAWTRPPSVASTRSSAGEEPPPPARLRRSRTSTGCACASTSSGIPTSAPPSSAPRRRGQPRAARSLGRRAARRVPRAYGVEVDAAGRRARTLRAERAEAAAAVRASRAPRRQPIAEVAAVLGGELAPFQWAGVRYALDARRAFLADEQGLGKTVEALAALEADDAFPAVVVCPASMKLIWEREARTGCRTAAWRSSPAAWRSRRTDEITIVNYELVAAQREALGRRRPRALVVDESHSSRTRAPSAPRRCGGSPRPLRPTGCGSR